MNEKEGRVDAWLWAVRVFKTRAASKEACLKGRVHIDEEPAKPARRVRVGDVVEARRGERRFVLEVRDVPARRVSAAAAESCYVDRSPPPEPRASKGSTMPIPGAQRDRGAGRPTKKDRRAIDRLRGRR